MLAAAGSRTRRAAVLRAAGGGPIVGLALTRARNPEAPREMVVADTAAARAAATTMIEAGVPLPVWVKDRDGWAYVGRWLPVRLVDDDAVMLLDPVGEVIEPSD